MDVISRHISDSDFNQSAFIHEMGISRTLLTEKIKKLTGFTPNALQQRASHCLYTIAEEQATNSASISACHAQGMLTDLLFIALIQQDLELAPERIRHSEALVKKLV